MSTLATLRAWTFRAWTFGAIGGGQDVTSIGDAAAVEVPVASVSVIVDAEPSISVALSGAAVSGAEDSTGGSIIAETVSIATATESLISGASMNANDDIPGEIAGSEASSGDSSAVETLTASVEIAERVIVKVESGDPEIA